MCDHEWQRIYEQGIIGGVFAVGWKCKKCTDWVTDVPLSGLPGKDSGERVLVGPHGGKGNCSDGSLYTRQILYPDGRIEIER